jgi:serine/threonine-protein phosphatase 6 regulatory ankyrin repeat subunit B
MTSLEFVEAAANNNLHKVREMLEANGDLLNAKDREHDTAIMKAARNCNATDVVSFLLSKGANFNDEQYRDTINQTPIIVAAQHGCIDIVRLLIEAGVKDINHKNDQGESALLTAAQEGHKEIVGILLEAGADINQPNSDGDTALAIVTRNRHKKDLIDFLIVNGANADASGIKRKRRRKTKRSNKSKRRTKRSKK